MQVKRIASAAALAIACALATAQAANDGKIDPKQAARGKYLIETSGCNDCHTAGYPQSAGKTPVKEWLKGDALGWRGPWGTTYATNLRLVMPQMTLGQWIKYARTMQPKPPMPWFNVRAMNDRDLTAIYWFVKDLGPAGEPAPAYLPPGQAPKGPAVQFPQ